MSVRVHLRSPFGTVVERAAVDGRWEESPTVPDGTLGEGLWALPGLVDAHAHLAADAMPPVASPTDLDEAAVRARDALGAGVTLLYDKGWSDETVLDLIEQVDPVERPHIEAAGRMIANPGGYYAGFATEINPDEVAFEVDRAIGTRASWVKLVGDWPRPGMGPVTNFNQIALEKAVAAAARLGARVAIHTMAREVPSMAVAAGIHSIEHGLFLSEPDLDPLAARGGMWVPTICQVEATAAALRPGSSGQALLVEGVANACRLLPLAIEAGVTVLAGTDLAVSSSEVASEAMRIARCGVDPETVLRIVAVLGHQAAGRSSTFELGAPADAVWFEENPLEHLGVLAHPVHVMREGRLVK